MIFTERYEAVRRCIEDACLQIAGTDEPHWTSALRASWLATLKSIERFLDGKKSERGFSIIRSLDNAGGLDGPTSDAIMRVAHELRKSGIDRYY